MIIIFDLDYTLLDMKIWKKMLADAMDISEEEYYETYSDYFYKNKIKYNIFKHLDYLIERKIISESKKEVILSQITEKIKNIDKALFPKAEEVLEKFKNKKYKLILITWGDNVWHGLKLNNLKIKKYFDKIVIADKKKGDCVDFLKNDEDKKVLINDNLKESIYLNEKLKNSEIFLIKSKYSRNCSELLPEYSLKDCLNLIK